MELLKALLLGIIQGLTEFLPVSSSGHIELGKAILNMELKDDLAFSIIVHLATVLSTILVFRKDIWKIISDCIKFQWNSSTKFVSYILLSMIPITILGLFFEEQIASLFEGNLVLVGISLIITAVLLLSTLLFHQTKKPINGGSAFLIGLAQAAAIIPGISRSGATIVTALNLGISRDEAARFSFLMVLLPIIGASILQIRELMNTSEQMQPEVLPLVLGFVGAFISGILACKIMLSIVKKGKISYFAYYCIIIGLLAIIWGWN